MSKIIHYFSFLTLTCFAITLHATTVPIMNIVPNFNPVTLSQSGQAGFTYTVTNNTNNGKQPQVLTNITVDPFFKINNASVKSAIQVINNTCTSINPGQSCSFEIFLTGNTNLPQQFILSPKVCAYNGAVCVQPAAANDAIVNVSILLPPMIAAGEYTPSSTMDTRPLVAVSRDGGTSWTFPTSVTQPQTTPPYINSSGGILTSSACSSTTCIATGSYQSPMIPLLALTQDGGTTWTFPTSITQPITTPAFGTTGSLSASACSNNLCIIGGSYSGGSATRPLLGVSQNGGVTWTFPSSITIPVTTPSFTSGGVFSGVSCYNSTCIAAGRYSSVIPALTFRPLIAVSQDGGIHWNYPTSVTSPNTTPAFTPTSSMRLSSASCSGTTCIAVGSYLSPAHPILALSQDNGTTWTFPTSITQPQTVPTFTSGTLSGSCCSGNLCIAVGSYVSGGVTRPLLALTNDGGTTWTFPSAITNPTLNPTFKSGSLAGAFCGGETCIATGQYTDMTNATHMLLALSQDGGISWTFPTFFTSAQTTNTLGNVTCKGTFCIIGASVGQNAPSVAVSQDGGVTWSFPTELTTPTTDPSFNTGFLSSVAIGS